MFITIDLLKRFDANGEYLEYLEKFYPNGAEIIEIMEDENTSKYLLHWLRANLSFSDEEKEGYSKSCGIEDSSNFWHSEKVYSSRNIVNSYDIFSSERIFGSNGVKYSFDIVNGELINNSKQIFFSHMIDDSQKILKSANISSSINTCHSKAIVRSRNVYNSENVFDSSEIISCNDVTNSYFCCNCESISNCLFCFDLQNAEYHIFNKAVSKSRFEFFMQQYIRFMEVELNFIKNGWPNNMAIAESPNVAVPKCWYEPISVSFWNWAKTLPNYDALALYKQTLLPQFFSEIKF